MTDLSVVVAKIRARCIAVDPPSDPLATPVVGSCLVWTGSKDTGGYGLIWHDGGPRTTHRLVALSALGVIEGLVVDHLCRNRACCNPDHFEMVSPAENSRRGAAYKHMRHRRCDHCGSEDGGVRSGQWYCRPCRTAYYRGQRAEIRADPERLEASRRSKRESAARYRATAAGRAESRARCRARRATGSTKGWMEFLDSSEREAIDAAKAKKLDRIAAWLDKAGAK